MTTQTIARRAAVVAIGACLLAGLAALVFGGRTAGAAVGAAAPATADVADSFAVLKRPLVASDAVAATPAGARILASSSAVVDDGLDVATARRVVPSLGSRLWVGRAGDRICLLREPSFDDRAIAPAATCHSLADALAGKTVTVMGSAPHVEVAGLVPDGVRSVNVRMADGSTVEAPVTDNAYDVVVDHPSAGIAYTNPDGTAIDLFAPSVDSPATQ